MRIFSTLIVTPVREAHRHDQPVTLHRSSLDGAGHPIALRFLTHDALPHVLKSDVDTMTRQLALHPPWIGERSNLGLF
jgi:hypothetical protein